MLSLSSVVPPERDYGVPRQGRKDREEMWSPERDGRDLEEFEQKATKLTKKSGKASRNTRKRPRWVNLGQQSEGADSRPGFHAASRRATVAGSLRRLRSQVPATFSLFPFVDFVAFCSSIWSLVAWGFGVALSNKENSCTLKEMTESSVSYAE